MRGFLRQLLASWPLAIVVLVMLPILVTLGFWQLHRGAEKRELLAEQLKQQALPPVVLETVDTQLPEHRKVSVRGRFDPLRYWLLENRIYQGRFGFELVSPFELETGAVILIHRGWLPGDSSRRLMPTVETPAGVVTLNGQLDRNFGIGFELASEQELQSWPKRRQWLPRATAEQDLGIALPDFVLRLEEAEPGMYRQTYQSVNMPPEKHIGYAVQWFGMAGIVLILFLGRAWRRRHL